MSVGSTHLKAWWNSRPPASRPPCSAEIWPICITGRTGSGRARVIPPNLRRYCPGANALYALGDHTLT